MEKVDFDELLDNCQRLESIIQVLMKSNASKQAYVNRLQAQMLESYNQQQKHLAEMEQRYQVELANIITRSDKLELEIKQVNKINDELREVVNRAQQASHVRPDMARERNESYHFMGAVIENLGAIRTNYKKLKKGIKSLETSSPEDSQGASELIAESKGLVIELHKNANLIRLFDKQGKFAEKQFDLILNQIPWQPLTPGYIKELRKYNNEEVRNLADTLALQVSEIHDLEESLIAKKEKKLELLKNLTEQLELFVRKRSEAILIEGQTTSRKLLMSE